MRDKTCCFTGHRMIPLLERNSVSKALERAIVESIENGYCYFGAGGALGFDTMAALTVLRLRSKYPHIKLILVLPCENQTRNWKAADIEKYEHIMSQADKVVYVSKEYTSDCMHRRNRHLVDNSSLCICYLTNQRGGTFYTVNYALKKYEYSNKLNRFFLYSWSHINCNANNSSILFDKMLVRQ